MMDLPGADLVSRGLDDLRQGRETIEALLVAIGAPRLRGLGHLVPDGPIRPESRLHALLARQHGADAHSRYNALVRRLVSYEHALERERSRRAHVSSGGGGGAK
jgi:hypothetical protein